MKNKKMKNVWLNLNNSGVITIIVLNEVSQNDNFRNSLTTVLFLRFF
jgi:hypothetical protein